MQTWLIPITLLAWTSLVAGCAANKEAVLPADGPDIQAIYAHHLHESGHNELQAVRKSLQENPARKADFAQGRQPCARCDRGPLCTPAQSGPEDVCIPAPGRSTTGARSRLRHRLPHVRAGGICPPR